MGGRYYLRRIPLAAVVVSLAALTTPIHAQRDVNELRARAQQGDAAAQFNLGRLYVTGTGVPQDDAQAARWYRLAADQGHAGAQHTLGFKYDNGMGVPEDDAEAVRWYRLAAEQGHWEAQFRLGRMYENGTGIAGNDAQAVRVVSPGGGPRPRRGAVQPRPDVLQRLGAYRRTAPKRRAGSAWRRHRATRPRR